MHDLYNEYEQLCEAVETEIQEVNKKLSKGNGKLSAGDVDYLDKLTHIMKSIKTTMAMLDADGGSYDDRSYTAGRMYNGRSYSNYSRKRDSMGRYSRDYSGNDEMIAQLRDLMADAPDEKTKQEFRRFIGKMESM